MIDRDRPDTEARAERTHDEKRRARYQRPVLTHLGSVNRLTLSASVMARGDGSKFVKVAG